MEVKGRTKRNVLSLVFSSYPRGHIELGKPPFWCNLHRGVIWEIYTPVWWVEREQTRERARPTGLALQKLGRESGAPVLSREGLGKGNTQPPYCTSPGHHLLGSPGESIQEPPHLHPEARLPSTLDPYDAAAVSLKLSFLHPSHHHHLTDHSHLLSGLPTTASPMVSLPYPTHSSTKLTKINKICPLSTNSRNRFSEYVTLVVSKEGNLSTARVNFMCKSDQLA